LRIVLDSSALIAAIARPGVCTELVDEVARDHTLVLSDYILGEVERKLREKFGLSAKSARSLVSGIRARSELVKPTPIPSNVCRDPDDLAILGTAVAAQAHMLATVDKDLLTRGEFQRIAIIKPGDFWRRLRGA
jgi:putative PIN family toxin of toxin-antitoxin system